jgi:hypothetical protein
MRPLGFSEERFKPNSFILNESNSHLGLRK